MQPEDFFKSYPVSEQCEQQLRTYHALLLKWQKAINLVGPKTLQESWHRHFADSAQVSAHIPEDAKTLIDIGSGAGFPGLVLAMMHPNLSVGLVESDERKAQFLRTVSRETSVDSIVYNARIESVELPQAPDIVSARALADLSLLFEYIYPWVEQNPNLTALFLKGQAASEEIEAARESFTFECEQISSKTEPSATLLLITKIKKI